MRCSSSSLYDRTPFPDSPRSCLDAFYRAPRSSALRCGTRTHVRAQLPRHQLRTRFHARSAASFSLGEALVLVLFRAPAPLASLSLNRLDAVGVGRTRRPAPAPSGLGDALPPSALTPRPGHSAPLAPSACHGSWHPSPPQGASRRWQRQAGGAAAASAPPGLHYRNSLATT